LTRIFYDLALDVVRKLFIRKGLGHASDALEHICPMWREALKSRVRKSSKGAVSGSKYSSDTHGWSKNLCRASIPSFVDLWIDPQPKKKLVKLVKKPFREDTT
jgi:hypothetical protein